MTEIIIQSTAFIYTGTQLALLVLWAKASSIQTTASVPAAALSFTSAMVVMWLSYFEHTRSVRPLSILSLYLLLSLVFDVVQVRTLYLLHDGSSIPSTFLTGMGIKLALFMLEMQEKRLILKAPYNRLPPEATSGVINQGFFWWLNGLFVSDFKRILDLDDLYEIDSSLASETLLSRFQAEWNNRGRI